MIHRCVCVYFERVGCGICLSWSVPVCCLLLQPTGFGENRRVSSYLAWPGEDMCAAPTAHWIGWMWAPEVGMYVHIHYDKRTCPHTGCTRCRHTPTQTHARTHFGGRSPRIVWTWTSCMYRVDCMPFGLALPIDWKHDRWLLEKVVPTSLVSTRQISMWHSLRAAEQHW